MNGTALNHVGNPGGNLVGCNKQGSIDVDVTLGDTSWGVAEQSFDSELRKIQISRNAGERVSEGVGRYAR